MMTTAAGEAAVETGTVPDMIQIGRTFPTARSPRRG